MDDWINLGLSKYFLSCEKCGNEIIINQIGDPIPEFLLPEVLHTVHVKNTYDSWTGFKYDKDRDLWLKINVDIENKKCKLKNKI